MKIIFNGESIDVQGRTLAAVLDELGHSTANVATAVNEEFVPATLRDTVELNAGDRLEVVAPRQGG